MQFTVKAIQRCACGAEIVVLRFRGPRTSCPACIMRAAQVRFKASRPGRKRELNRKWSTENPEKDRASKDKWQSENKEYGAHKTAKYLSRKKKAMPPWADVEKIKAIYKACPHGFHVDHIYPLHGKTVTGLHVETNLQYLLAFDNRSKSNKLIEGNA